MKRCPTCNAGYQDDTLSFCLNDGTPLVFATLVENSTVLINETDTVVRPAAERNWNESQVTRVANLQPPPAQKKGSRVGITILVAAIGTLLLFLVLIVAGVFIYMGTGAPAIANANTKVVTQPKTPSGNATTSPMPSPSPTSSNANLATPKPTPSGTPLPVPSPPVPPTRASYPPTKRLQFGKGSFTTSVSGEINPNDSRSFVLACRSGQTLTALVSGGDGCVTTNGSRWTTTGGDNSVVVRNSCDNLVKFSLSISVF